MSCQLYAYLKSGEFREIRTSSDVVEDIIKVAENGIRTIEQSKQVEFDIDYKPNEDEVLFIKNFDVSDAMKKLHDLEKPLTGEDVESVRYLVFKLTDQEKLAFQVFESRKILSQRKLAILFSQDTFLKINQQGLVIDEKIDAFYDLNSKTLFFYSYYNASRIFDTLSDFVREITDQEIQTLKASECITLQSLVTIEQMKRLSSRMKRKLNNVIKSGIIEKTLERYGKDYNLVEHIKRHKMDKYFSDRKIIFPEDKEQLEDLIKFFNDDLFYSPLSDILYETNSKRQKNQ
ncbi:MAG: Kiwa anti-phage protein KwaB-like domain-containing protein [Fervidobacterium sp.]|uniref:Kiwa anti-phage protein KwaB-like domain-containing protein n=1 Tax=Fervidobacterium TaxID=2422 RepID=UPI0030AF7074